MKVAVLAFLAAACVSKADLVIPPAIQNAYVELLSARSHPRSGVPDGYLVPSEPPAFTVRVRQPRGEWQNVPCHSQRVRFQQGVPIGVAVFDFSGEVEVEAGLAGEPVREAQVLPQSRGIQPEIVEGRAVFRLRQPQMLAVVLNGRKLDCLHLVTRPVEEDLPSKTDPNVIWVWPGVHSHETNPGLIRREGAWGADKPPLDTLEISAGKTLYLAPGAIVQAQINMHHADGASIRGRGIIDLRRWNNKAGLPEAYRRGLKGVDILSSRNVTIEGLTMLAPVHYSICAGGSRGIRVREVATFSLHLWSDGFDFQATSDVVIRRCFLRNSDDCIAIYADYSWPSYSVQGDSENWLVEDCVLWADFAHAIHMGTSGSNDPANRRRLRNLTFRDIDVLEHRFDNEHFDGVMAISCGAENIVSGVLFEDIRVEEFTRGQLVNIRFVRNEWAREFGQRVEDIVFRRIRYNAREPAGSSIFGQNRERVVRNVRFEDLQINGRKIMDTKQMRLRKNALVENLTFE